MDTNTEYIVGKCIRAGTFVCGDEEITGVAISASVEVLRGTKVPMYESVALVKIADLERMMAELAQRRAKCGDVAKYAEEVQQLAEILNEGPTAMPFTVVRRMAEGLVEDRKRLRWIADHLVYMMVRPSAEASAVSLPNRGHGWAHGELEAAIDAAMQQEGKS